jgi:hypothetical protein
MHATSTRHVLACGLVAAMCAACGTVTPATSPSQPTTPSGSAGVTTGTPSASQVPILASPAGSPSSDASASAPPDESPAASVIVTIAVRGERYRVRLTEPVDIRTARALVGVANPAAAGLPGIPNGLLAAGTDVNTGYAWHIDPADFVWAEIALEECDGRPSSVGPGFQSDRYCPTSAVVIRIAEAAP